MRFWLQNLPTAQVRRGGKLGEHETEAHAFTIALPTSRCIQYPLDEPIIQVIKK